MTADIFAGYDRRFRRALDAAQERRPWVDVERAGILAAARRCLGLETRLVPTLEVRMIEESTPVDGEKWTIEHLEARSWPGVWGAADLYLPRTSGPAPAVILACGHAAGGKRAHAYRALAGLLAGLGVAVLVSDNIGQGERVAMGHREVPGVFACELSLQGLIVMETMAWLRWLQGDPRIDRSRIGLVGNSGGGLLALLAGALCRDELAVVSSGFPSTFAFVARKEKQHCHCTLLPGIIGELEMWQLYGSIAPTPLLLFQGREDHFFPEDLFWETVRQTSTAFDRAGTTGRFAAEVLPGGHGWDAGRRHLLARFVCAHLSVPWREAVTEPPQPPLPACFPAWPRAAVTTEQLARRLSGCDREAADLADVFPVDVPPAPVPLLRGDPRLIAAQYEAFLRRR